LGIPWEYRTAHSELEQFVLERLDQALQVH